MLGCPNVTNPCEQCDRHTLEECMRCYGQGRSLCAAAAVVEHLIHMLRDAEHENDACQYLDLFRKWTYIAGGHLQAGVPRRVALSTTRAPAQIIRFRPRGGSRAA